MIIFAGLAAVVAAVGLLGGRLSALTALSLRATPAMLVAVALQLGVAVAGRAFPAWAAASLHVASYGAAVVFLWSNRRLPYLWIAAAGGALNLAAIVANGGRMPASRAALASAGLPLSSAGDGFANSAAVPHARLAFLGDVFAVPKGWPFANVFSVGDVVLLIGAAALVVSVCGAPRARCRGAALASK